MIKCGTKMKCMIGLGNPGRKYNKTRHNIGFMVIDELYRRHALTGDQNKFNCEYTISHINNEKVMLVKPLTFMNLSGEGVRPLLEYYNISPQNTIVAYDDLDLPTGTIRLRHQGGHGGHNGIRSLIDHLGTKEFKRLRIGIGRPTDRTPIVNYVLQPFSKGEMESITTAIMNSADVCEAWLEQDFTQVMNQFNQ